MIRPAKLLRTAFLTVALSAVCVVAASAASLGVGTVNTDALRLRAEASTSSTILATASKGDTVVIMENAGNGWYKVNYNTIEGYMSGGYLNVAATANVTIGYGMVDVGNTVLNVRSGPGTGYSKVTSLSDGTVVSIVGISNGWYKITTSGGVTGYVSSEYMDICKSSAGSRGETTSTSTTTSSSMGQQVVNYALSFLGTPYVYGGNGPSCFDCSGFTNYVYRHFGYILNRGASSQLQNGTPVSKSDLQPGDIVFFRYNTTYPASHCGIYIGNGQFVHASTNKYQVQISQLTSGHYANVYLTARRIL